MIQLSSPVCGWSTNQDFLPSAWVKTKSIAYGRWYTAFMMVESDNPRVRLQAVRVQPAFAKAAKQVLISDLWLMVNYPGLRINQV
jgi:hypothetical protein